MIHTEWMFGTFYTHKYIIIIVLNERFFMKNLPRTTPPSPPPIMSTLRNKVISFIVTPNKSDRANVKNSTFSGFEWLFNGRKEIIS